LRLLPAQVPVPVPLLPFLLVPLVLAIFVVLLCSVAAMGFGG